jgi:glycosyltransferase involved in cell wall biosynthesis
MPDLYPKYDVLLVPSTWPEPLARVVLEGMASGLVVVATPTGGTTEIIVNGENGLIFASDDAEDLAQKVAELASDSELRHRLAATGRQTVMEKFNLDRMIDQVENYLLDVAGLATYEKAMRRQPKF